MTTNYNNFFSNFIPLPVSDIIFGNTPAKSNQTTWNPSQNSSQSIPAAGQINAQNGYITNNFDILSQSASKQKSIKQTNLLDFSVLETDKNFSKINIQNQLNTGIAQLALATQTAKMVLTQFNILQVKEYNPTSVQNSVFNTQSLNNSNTNFLPVFQQGTTEKTFSQSLTTDINTLYADKNVILADLVAISNIINTAFPSLKTIQNNPIQSILGINLQSYLPISAIAIVTSPLLADSLSNAGLTSPEQATFNNNLTNFINTQTSMPISTMVTSQNYTNVPITMADPLGINIATQMTTEIKNNFNNNLTTFMNSQSITDPSTIALIKNDFSDNVDSGVYQILPKMTSVVNGVNVSVTNSLGSAMILAMDNIILNVMTDLGIIVPANSTLSKIDLLQNLHRNIQDRQNILDKGGSLNDTATLDAELIPYFAAGSYSPAALSALISNFEVFVNG
jgi:hypothetical protein